MLEIKNIRKTYASKKGAEVRALDGVSIAFPERGLVFILGKSGSGKSTLLNICGGLDRADEGEIVIRGVSSAGFSPADFDSYRNTCVGFVFQEYDLLEEFTVEENISVALELQGRRNAQKIADTLRSVEMEAFAKRKPNTLSGGQKQRVAIARALVKDPQIILADEPTGALDSGTGRQVLDTLKKLSADKLVIAVSHDREFAEQYADRIIELKDGKVLSDVTRAGEAGEAPNVRFYEDTAAVRDCARLTEEDFAAIRRFLSSSKSGAMLSYDRVEVAKAQSAMPDCAGKFEETRGQPAPRAYAAEEQRFIRSKMPFRHAFRLGASCVRTHPVRLAFSILLCLVAFTMFGLFSTLMFFDAPGAARGALYNADFTYLNCSKGYSVTRNDYINGELTATETYVSPTGMTAKEYAALQGQYPGALAALETGSAIGLQGWSVADERFYTDTFSGYAYAAGNEGMPALLWGRYPQDAGEAAISDFTFRCLCCGTYTDPQTGEEIGIESYEDLNGLPALALPGATVKIVGVYSAEAVPERFEPLRKASEEHTASDAALTSLSNEWRICRDSGFYTYLLMHDSFAEQFRAYLAEREGRADGDHRDLFTDSDRNAVIFFDEESEVWLRAFNTYTEAGGLPLLPLYSVQSMQPVTSLAEGEAALSLGSYATLLSGSLADRVNGLLAEADGQEERAFARAAHDAFYSADPDTGAESISDALLHLSSGYAYEESEGVIVARPYTREEALAAYEGVLKFMDEYGLAAPAFRMEDGTGQAQSEVRVSAFFYAPDERTFGDCAYLSPDLFEAYFRGEGIEKTEYVTKYVSPDGAFIAGAFIPDFRGNGALDALTEAAYSVGADDSVALIRNSEMDGIDRVVSTVLWLRWFTLGAGAGLTAFAVLLLFNFIASSITAKKREIGILRALGARGADVYKIFFSEALLVAAACFLLGAIACAAICPSLSALIVQGMGISATVLRFSPLSALFMAAVALFTAALSTLVPVALYSQKPPVESIRAL